MTAFVVVTSAAPSTKCSCPRIGRSNLGEKLAEADQQGEAAGSLAVVAAPGPPEVGKHLGQLAARWWEVAAAAAAAAPAPPEAGKPQGWLGAR